MCALKSRGMSAVCTWGLRVNFFLTLVLFVLFAHSAVCFCVIPFSYAYDVLYNICTPLSYTRYVKISNTPDFMFN